MEEHYDPYCWTCAGPTHLTNIAQKLWNVTSMNQITPSSEFPAVPLESIQPNHQYDKVPGWYFSATPVTFESWRHMLENASALHFFNQITKNFKVEDDPSHFLYALLGPKYCPNSYYSTNYF